MAVPDAHTPPHPFPAELAALVATFAAHEDAYTAPEFKEAQVRQQFLDPLFAALGWDIANTQGYAEAYKEVIHEDALKIGGETKAPDYSFRIGGQRKFFVEAKKPSVLIKDHPEPAYQLRRYSWSAKLPLGILTDFQEFAVYDTRVKPAPTDKASAARLFYCRYDELEKHWAFIAGTFSKEAILKGSFDKYAATTKGKRGTATVDDAFLEEIENWRDLLARNLALRNPALDTRGLNFAVQRTIDRIVFLRIAEDRGNEPFGQLQALTAGPKIYPRLVEIFEKADYRYNSGLFHFAKDADCAETPDTLTPGLAIDDAVLKEILGSLYYPKSPYAFGVLPAYILGHVYEQFLGKVIRLTDGHQAKVEEKPEVRKAGGVYYTPQYIVDYIVQKTLDPLLADQTPKQIETLAVLDPACGSGTFLLGAYDHLLKWYLAHYSANAPEKWAKQGRLYETAPNAHGLGQGSKNWQLTTTERKRILLAHIHGVDIDAAAVEVTKLSLLLKVLEGERREFQGKTKEMSAVLPDLSKNIKCGNSLIGHDFYAQPDLPTLDAEAKYKLNTFEWKDDFREVMKRGGFDAVIGNPPYVRSQNLEDAVKTFLSKSYETARYQPDLFAFFIEKGAKLLRDLGRLSFIIPNGFLTNSQYAPLRRYLVNGLHVEIVVDLKSGVFDGASVDTSIVVIRKPGSLAELKSAEILIGESPVSVERSVRTPTSRRSQASILQSSGTEFNTGSSLESEVLCRKIREQGNPISDHFTVKAGMKVRKEFVTPSAKTSKHKKFLLGASIKPYAISWRNKWVEYDKKLEGAYTNQAFRDAEIFEASPKLLIRQVMGPDRIYCAFDAERFYVDQSVYALVPKITFDDAQVKCAQAVLASKLMAFYFGKTMADRKETFPKIKGVQIASLPLCLGAAAARKKISERVTESLALHRAQAAAQSPHEKDALAKQVTATDRQIDALVYQLYGLTPEEIALVEGTAETADAVTEA